MFSIRSWPTVILHLDGDAFFASVIQAVNPRLKGKPVVIGAERGIATAYSYEAKKLGVTRGMTIGEVRRRFPTCIICHSDYRTYELFSQKMTAIISKYSPTVERYSIDEMFADLSGLRNPLHGSYQKIARRIKKEVEDSLDISVSVGVSLTKSLAKLASNADKPSGLTIVPGNQIEQLLSRAKIENVWGIGHQTSAYLKKLGIETALDFANKPDTFIKKYLNKPYYEIWLELHGKQIYPLKTGPKTTYKSIASTATFRPTSDKETLWSRLIHHVEMTFVKARRLHYQAGRVEIFLKTQRFSYHSLTIKLLSPTSLPSSIRKELREGFEKIYREGTLYRTTGVTISDLTDAETVQQTLFSDQEEKDQKMKRIYPLFDTHKIDFGSRLFDRNKLKKESSSLTLPTIK